MEGLALSAVTIAALSLPGLIVYYSYVDAAAGWEIKGSVEFVTPRAAASALVISMVFHSTWGYALARAGHPLPYDALVAVLTDAKRVPTVSPLIVIQVTAYLVSQFAAAWVLGLGIAAGAQRFGWSEYVALKSNGAVWHRLLKYTDKGNDFVMLTIAHTEGAQTFLYRGLLESYQLDQEGRLLRVVLEGAARRDFPSSTDEMEPDTYDGGWAEIPGEWFVVNCENVDTIDVDYFWLQTAPPNPVSNVEFVVS